MKNLNEEGVVFCSDDSVLIALPEYEGDKKFKEIELARLS